MDVSSAAFGMLRNVEGATVIGVLATDLANSNSALRAVMVSLGANSAASRAGINARRGFFDGQIAELIVYDRVLSASALELVDNYILEKWINGATPILGDINCDGLVNFLDVAPFIEALSTGSFSDKADFNLNGAVGLLDISGFIAVLSGG